MRIIIESNEPEGVPTSIRGLTEPAPMEVMDGGPPSEALVQAISQAQLAPSDVTEAREGIDAGQPPEWLITAIQQATTGMSVATADSDAGAAPAED